MCHLRGMPTAGFPRCLGTRGLYQTCIIHAQPLLMRCIPSSLHRGTTRRPRTPPPCGCASVPSEISDRTRKEDDVTHIAGWAADPAALAAFLEEPNLARLGTIDEAGDPHVVPVWFAWDGTRFLVGADVADHKVENLRR